ncbi:MAG TPA: hypothetical protein VJL78_03010, partial [Candidatus Nitrosocosmicus sp.]|nr:hypothetical protein [Candidatus Nitrosocosmicus sp.]
MKINAKQQSGVFCPRQTSILGSQRQVLVRKESDHFFVREEQYLILKIRESKYLGTSLQILENEI